MFTNSFNAGHRFDLKAPPPNQSLDLIVSKPALLKKFRLEDIGVDTEELARNLSSTFDSLPADTYHRKLRQVQFLKKLLPCYCQRLDRFIAD